MLLVPGWATDSGIFEPLDMPFNYFLPENMSPLNFDEAFTRSMDELKASGLHLFGWSMGGFIAARLASKYPSMFKSVILVSVRRRYEKDVIGNIKGYIRKNTKAYLYKFYEGLFSESEKENRKWFKTKLFRRYMAEMSPEFLLEGLDYLSRTELECDGLAGSDVAFVHGDADDVAPIEEAKALKEGLHEAKFFSINGARHLPFLRKEFRACMGF
jgi:pimeloyl-[acyl-carrier protein] methyl ester esterase